VISFWLFSPFFVVGIGLAGHLADWPFCRDVFLPPLVSGSLNLIFIRSQPIAEWRTSGRQTIDLMGLDAGFLHSISI